MKHFKKVLSMVLTFSVFCGIMSSMLTSPASANTRPMAMILFDQTNTRTTGQLESDFASATNAIRTTFRVNFNLYMTARSSWLDGWRCSRPNNEHCTRTCGSDSLCNRPLDSFIPISGHHRSSVRLLGLAREPNVHVIRIVGHALCRWNSTTNRHYEVLGTAIMPGRDSIITNVDWGKGINYFRYIGVIQHELSHNLGAPDCNNNCVMNNPTLWVNVWCAPCDAAIRARL
jgi:hypothetical protein